MDKPDWLIQAEEKGLIGKTTTVNIPNLMAQKKDNVATAVTLKFLENCTEKFFQNFIINYGQGKGWKVVHFRKARVKRKGKWKYETPFAGNGKGWPDTFFAREGRKPIVAELKVDYNQPTHEQLEWLALLAKIGFDAYVWYPKDWETIREILE